MPRGPTLYFKVESYCLAKDVAASQRRPHSPATEFLAPPLVVLNNMQVLWRGSRLGVGDEGGGRMSSLEGWEVRRGGRAPMQ